MIFFWDKYFKFVAVSVLFLALVGLGIFCKTIASNSYKIVETNQIKRAKERSRRALSQQFEFLQDKASDWANWNESYDFLAKKKTDFLSENLTPSAFNSLQINMIALFDTEWNVKALSYMEHTNDEEFLNLPKQTLSTLEQEVKSRYQKNDAKGISDVFSVNKKPVLTYVSKVFKGDGTGPSTGYVMMGLTANDDFVVKYGSNLVLQVEMSAPDHIIENEVIFTRSHSSFLIPLKNSHGEVEAQFKVSNVRDVFMAQQVLMSWYRVIYMAMVFSICLIVYGFLSNSSVKKNIKNLLDANQSLKENEAHLEALLAAIPGYVSWFDKNLNYLGVNQKLADVFKMPRKSFIGKKLGWHDYERVKDLAPLLKDFIAGKQNHIQFEQDELMENGQPKRILFSAERYGYKNGIVLIGLDITEKWNAQQTAKLERERSENAARLSGLGEMAAGVAHEINNPLAIIQGFTIKIKKVISPSREYSQKIIPLTEKIEATVERVSKIVRGLRSISREGRYDPFMDADIPKLIDEVLSFCTERYSKSGIKLEYDITKECPLVPCRKVQVSQSLLNLLNNAHDAVAGTENPWVRVTAYTKEDKLVISVTDSGNGIDPKLQEKIMNPFFTTKAAGKGTGLGLSITKTMIDDHHGRFYYDVDSKNTKFVIELPLIQTQ